MKEIDIRETIRVHNSTNVFKVLIFSLISVVCWYISYWLIWSLVCTPLSNFGVSSAQSISHVIAFIAMGVGL